ncbi:MAG: CoA pyrophosphatase [Chitinophagales bacterium]|nr:CoA pyrophosphatase [Chitinophagales bacterium]MDW8427969.1 CoA pyrophosphatase [Chitinophagales bacterium]
MQALRLRLQEPLPGKKAHALMASSDRLKDAYYAKRLLAFKRHSAVLVLLYPFLHDINTLLIRRTADSGPHSGQVGFPGGKIEPTDAGAAAAALREAREELGIECSAIEVLGQLTPVYIPVSDQVVCPVVAFSTVLQELRPNPQEVAYVVHLRCADLIQPQRRKRGVFSAAGGLVISAPYFDISGEQIWGATALILSELACLLYPGMLAS